MNMERKKFDLLGVLVICLILVVSMVFISGCQKTKFVDNQAETTKNGQNSDKKEIDSESQEVNFSESDSKSEKDIMQGDQLVENEVEFSNSEPDGSQSHESDLPSGESEFPSEPEEPLISENTENSVDSEQPEESGEIDDEESKWTGYY